MLNGNKMKVGMFVRLRSRRYVERTVAEIGSPWTPDIRYVWKPVFCPESEYPNRSDPEEALRILKCFEGCYMHTGTQLVRLAYVVSDKNGNIGTGLSFRVGDDIQSVPKIGEIYNRFYLPGRA